MMELPDGRDLPYWKTGRSDPGAVLQRAADKIEDLGGQVTGAGFGRDVASGRVAYMISFQAADDSFKVIWPVLGHDAGDEIAARRQAATMLYHDVKAKAVKAAVFGIRVAFFEFLLLDDGRVAAAIADPAQLERLALPEAKL